MRDRVTINDVAHAAGISKSAVSNALSGRGRVAPETRARIVNIATALGWAPSIQARGLSQSRAFSIGMIFARPAQLIGADPFFAPFIAGVEEELSGRDYSLLTQIISSDEIDETRAYRQLIDGNRVDGMILTDLRQDDRRLDLLRELGMPFVTVGRPSVPVSQPSLYKDDGRGVEQVIEHLAKLGHRHMAQVTGPDLYVHERERERAFHAALASRGLPAGAVASGDFTAQSGSAGFRLLMDRNPRPTAIVFANALMAIAASQEAATAGIRIPGDVSIVALDDISVGPYLTPALTALSANILGWGKLSARALLEVLNGQEAIDQTIIETVLEIRGSTSAPDYQATSIPSS